MSPSAKRLLPAPSPLYVPSQRPDEFWEIALCGELTDKETDHVQHLVEVPKNSRGVIYFDTGGGSVYAGLALATIIKLRGLYAIGVVAGECSSAALLPFAACTERYVTPHSTLLFHPMRWQSEEDVRFEEAAEWARHFKIMEEDIDRLLIRMFQLSEATLSDWTRPGRFLTGKEIVTAGLAKELDLFAGDLWTQILERRKASLETHD
jgi:ATP-dependent protease ClpP protease subunit